MSDNIPRTSSTDKETQDKAPPTSVAMIYIAKVAEICRNVTVTWSKQLMNYSLTITLENTSNEKNHYTCKIDLKAWTFWGKKGLRSFDVDGGRMDVYWDFRLAKFSGSPEPSSDYYVALVYGEQVVLVVGDLKEEACKRTNKRPSLVEPTLLCKKENVHGKKLFCSKAMLFQDKKERDIVIEISTSDVSDPEMWISIDGYQMIHVMNLQWSFRGNDKVMINNVLVEIFWDVHNWLFSSSGTGLGLFILKPREPDNGNDDGKATHEFFHVIEAWKFE